MIQILNMQFINVKSGIQYNITVDFFKNNDLPRLRGSLDIYFGKNIVV